MALSMARCIGRSDCTNNPNGGRGLCKSCYSRHYYQGSLCNYPTMHERTAELTARGLVPRTQQEVSSRAKRARRGVLSPQRLRAIRAYQERKREERFEVDGVWVHPASTHGRLTTYNAFACRGPMCRATLRHYRRTGECALPQARRRNFTWEDCLDYREGAL